MNIKNMLPNTNKSFLKVVKNNKIIIENYGIINELSNNKIVLKEYVIEGNNIKIKRMDGFLIEIKGQISKIIFI